MTDNLVAGEAWPKLASNNDAGDRPQGAAPEILRISPQVILVFGSAPAVPRDGAWYRFVYHQGEHTVEIARMDGAVRGGTASVACLVHADWIAEFGAALGDDAGGLQPGAFHLPSDLAAIAAKACRTSLTGAARAAYRTAKGLELLCETAQASLHGKLIAVHRGSGLSASDMQRLFTAKRTIAEQFEKKLTLDSISRSCGLNRAKLTRAFKTVFGTSIAEALSEERLCRASLLLQTTDRPVSNIGYEAGYLNNASFTRAFSRRFGVCPSEFRQRRMSEYLAA
ncbi:MAG TPA: AraC family transcriptional regulator [Rhizomicrobium sp.]|jgi:AraC-like DNA-binding protein|nr:AraC family transcriptional regulator [Rhizomicrobium sp.]